MLDARRRELGSMLKTARLDAHLSVRVLASRVGVGPTQIVRLEQGTTAKPDVEVLTRLATALRLPLASVLDAAGIPLHRYLPDLGSYLRERYPDLPDEALAEMERSFEQISRDHHGGGPARREDES